MTNAINTQGFNAYKAQVLFKIINFSSLIVKTFQCNGFLSLEKEKIKGTIKIKPLQGIDVVTKGNDIVVEGIFQHILTEKQNQLLKELNKKNYIYMTSSKIV